MTSVPLQCLWVSDITEQLIIQECSMRSNQWNKACRISQHHPRAELQCRHGNLIWTERAWRTTPIERQGKKSAGWGQEIYQQFKFTVLSSQSGVGRADSCKSVFPWLGSSALDTPLDSVELGKDLLQPWFTSSPGILFLICCHSIYMWTVPYCIWTWLGNYCCQYIFYLRENRIKVLKRMFPQDTGKAESNFMLNSSDISCAITNRSANSWTYSLPPHLP